MGSRVVVGFADIDQAGVADCGQHLVFGDEVAGRQMQDVADHRRPVWRIR
jgi:hypothetical protein